MVHRLAQEAETAGHITDRQGHIKQYKQDIPDPHRELDLKGQQIEEAICLYTRSKKWSN